MLVVLLLLPLSLAVEDGEFNHGEGSGCGGSPGSSSSGRGGRGGVGQRLAAKAAGNKSVDGCMTACDDKSGWWTTAQQPIK
jgi:hypothetical protein